MANVAPVTTKVGLRGKAWISTWTALTAANSAGDAVSLPEYADRSVQVIGTFDSATVVLQGSNDGTNWVTLTDPQGNVISATSAKLEQIEEATLYVRPSTSGGGGSQSVSVILFHTGNRQP